MSALGASTKGNVVLQYCGLDERRVNQVGEVNETKFGCFTPGSLIPIVPEGDLLKTDPDYLLILPWHFRSFSGKHVDLKGRNLLFPLADAGVGSPGVKAGENSETENAEVSAIAAASLTEERTLQTRAERCRPIVDFAGFSPEKTQRSRSIPWLVRPLPQLFQQHQP